MSIINDFVDDLINKYKVFPYTLFVKDSTIVSKDLHHSVDDIHHKRRRHVELGRCHEVNSEFLGKEEVQAFNILQSLNISNSHVLTKEGGGSPSHIFTLR